MAFGKWAFRLVSGELFLTPPAYKDRAMIAPLLDFTSTELGPNLETFDAFVGVWRNISSDPVSAKRGLSGNSTHLRVEGNQIVLSGLYKQWHNVRIPVDEFNDYLDQYRAFLAQSGRR